MTYKEILDYLYEETGTPETELISLRDIQKDLIPVPHSQYGLSEQYVEELGTDLIRIFTYVCGEEEGNEQFSLDEIKEYHPDLLPLIMDEMCGFLFLNL